MLADAPHRRPNERRLTERGGDRARQAVGASLDSVDPFPARHTGGRELIDERDEGQVLGIREEEPAQAAQAARERCVGVDAHHPLGDRLSCDPLGHRGIPSFSGQHVVGNLAAEPARRLAEHPGPGAKPAAAAPVRTVVPESLAKDPDRRQLDRRREPLHERLAAFDEVGAGLGVLPGGKAVSQREHAAAHAIPRLDDRHRGARRLEVPRGGKPRKPRAGDNHPLSRKLPCGHV